MARTDQLAPGTGLDAFFDAKGIAIVGASGDITKIGGRPVHLLKKYGYAGPIYPINPKADEVQGLTSYASVRDTPTAPDMAILAVPAQATADALRDCAARGVRAAVVLSSGFAEAGPEGVAMQDELVAIAREANIRLLGPNCLGTVSTTNAAIGSFSIVLEENMPAAGHVGIVSQSGNIGSFTVQNVVQRGLGLSRFIATGNEADVDVADGIAALAEDENTRVILCCMETCRDADRLIDALARARARNKPVIVLKIGATELGQAAAASHTGALAGSDAVIDAVFRRHGALRVYSLEALLDVGQAASQLMPGRLPAGDKVTLVAASGGFGIMMADAMSEAGMELPALSPDTQARIREAVPSAGTNNPVDASAQMSSRPDILFKMLSALLEEPNSDATVLFMSLALHNQRLRGVYMETLARIRQDHPERLLMVISSGPADAVAQIRALGIPVFASIDAAAEGTAGLVRLGRLAQLGEASAYTGARAPVDPAVFRNEFHAKQALGAAGIAVLPEALVISADDAVAQADRLGYPVVLKIASEDIQHKTEIGGVALRLADAAAVRDAHARILASAQQHAPKARIDGVLVAPMAQGGVELIAGVSRDPVFGPVVMVGMGGIYAEVLKDVAVQTAPVSVAEAESMIRGLKLFALLDGARGQPKADVAAAAQTVARLSEFACRHADDVAEIDMNPVLVRPQGEGVVVLDALMIPTGATAPSTH
ncbi:acetate--CoA ligase family protein [Achromobacter sp. GG226]|uniref:acetate--CoA ligase family protein n=1 Tax=Verticiella alkaliphila TaxID=2779529 RepID=UPI001C0CD16A|nr:acetate--CoA ligase family protein [Verticiella sp. GG226]MBU4609399.1 acetate--CoA ligase family protein [Verticiella sp. GG226]